MMRLKEPILLAAQQLLLLLATLTASVVLGGLAGLLYGHEPMWSQFVSVIVMLTGLFAPLMIWGCREDESDLEARWLLPMTLAIWCVIGPLTYGVPTLYQERYGVVVVAAVTEDRNGTSEPGTSQWIRAREVATGEDLGLFWVADERDLQVDSQVEVLADPHGWMRTFDPHDRHPETRRLMFWAALIGVAGMVVLSSLRAGRDIRRWRRDQHPRIVESSAADGERHG